MANIFDKLTTIPDWKNYHIDIKKYSQKTRENAQQIDGLVMNELVRGNLKICDDLKSAKHVKGKFSPWGIGPISSSLYWAISRHAEQVKSASIASTPIDITATSADLAFKKDAGLIYDMDASCRELKKRGIKHVVSENRHMFVGKSRLEEAKRVISSYKPTIASKVKAKAFGKVNNDFVINHKKQASDMLVGIPPKAVKAIKNHIKRMYDADVEYFISSVSKSQKDIKKYGGYIKDRSRKKESKTLAANAAYLGKGGVVDVYYSTDSVYPFGMELTDDAVKYLGYESKYLDTAGGIGNTAIRYCAMNAKILPPRTPVGVLPTKPKTVAKVVAKVKAKVEKKVEAKPKPTPAPKTSYVKEHPELKKKTTAKPTITTKAKPKSTKTKLKLTEKQAEDMIIKGFIVTSVNGKKRKISRKQLKNYEVL